MTDQRCAVKTIGLYKVFAPQAYGAAPVVALKNVSIEIPEGSLTVVGGANGSGKSVLMAIIAQLMKPTEGTCLTSEKPGLVFQEAATQILGDTPEEDVAVGPRNQKINKKEIPGIVSQALADVHLAGKADFPSHLLSGGEKRRLCVASILAMKRNILIFDEPYANLDYPGVCDVNALITQLHKQKKTIIILTHELEKCLALADRFIILHEGSVVFDGIPEAALSQDLSQWGIRNPLVSYHSLSDLVWKS